MDDDGHFHYTKLKSKTLELDILEQYTLLVPPGNFPME
jgi:hypothetical protein